MHLQYLWKEQGSPEHMKYLLIILSLLMMPAVASAQIRVMQPERTYVYEPPVRTYLYRYPVRPTRRLVEYYPGLEPRVFYMRPYQPVYPVYPILPYGVYYYGY